MPLEQDLASACRFFESHDIPTWVFEEAGMQCLCVPSGVDPEAVQQVLQQWQLNAESGLDVPVTRDQRRSLLGESVLAQWRQFPLTVLLLLAALVCYLAIATPLGWMAGGERWLQHLTFQTIFWLPQSLEVTPQWPSLSELWRFWTPVLLHFSFFHILFNGVMMLELGRRLEVAQGRVRWVVVVLGCGVVSNIAQFIFSPDTVFGGLSGVVYALVGYGWLYQRIHPANSLVAPGLMVVVLVWQALCFSGVITLAGLGSIANAAHVAGLIAGVMLGGLMAILDKAQSAPGLPPSGLQA